jgi:hypothetical protein
MDKNLALTMLLRPLMLLVFMALIVAPLKWFFGKLIPEGRIKRALWRRLN